MTLKSGLKLGKKIGEGHFGEVFLGNDPVHGDVAVKRIEKDPMQPDNVWNTRKDDLLKEAQNLKKATHRNVVQVYHLLEEESGDAILYVMAYCRKGSLQAVYDKGPLSLKAVRKIATEVSLGLQALHSRTMIHRDIKPGNLLIDDKNVAQIGDFGLVTDNLILGYGSQAGYWDHIAPEVHHGGGTSVKTDVWALGMTLYRLVHGAVWYAESPPPKSVVASGGFADTLRWLPHVTKRWRRTIRTMLHDDTSKRYQSSTDVLSALSGLPISPEWNCTLSPAEIRWWRITGSRRIVIVLNRSDLNHHSWSAWSEPLGVGRQRTLAGSKGVVKPSTADRQLRAFFEAQT